MRNNYYVYQYSHQLIILCLGRCRLTIEFEKARYKKRNYNHNKLTFAFYGNYEVL